MTALCGLALLVYRKLDEPERGAADGLPRTMEVPPPSFRRMPESSEAEDGLPRTMEVPPFWFSLKTLMASPTFRHLSFATGLYTVLWLGVVQWLPSFFTRSFGLGIGEVGTWLAIILSTSQLIGMLTGGYLADRLGASDLRWYVWVPSLAILVSTPMFALTFLTQNPMVAFLSLFLPFMIGVMQGPPSFAVAQGFERTPKHEPVSLLRYAVTFKQRRWNMGLRVAGTGDRGLHVASSSQIYQ